MRCNLLLYNLAIFYFILSLSLSAVFNFVSFSLRSCTCGRMGNPICFTKNKSHDVYSIAYEKRKRIVVV